MLTTNKMEKLFDDADGRGDEEITLESAFGLWKDKKYKDASLCDRFP
jgi:hypothetical protein